MKAKLANCSLLSRLGRISALLCSRTQRARSYTLFCTGSVYSAMISLSAVYFCTGKQFRSIWLTKGVQVLVLEQRNKEYHAECSNTSVIAGRMSFKEMVGERERESNQQQTTGDQSQPDFRKGSLQDRASWGDCTVPVKIWLGVRFDRRNLKGTEWPLSAIGHDTGNMSLQCLCFQDHVQH